MGRRRRLREAGQEGRTAVLAAAGVFTLVVLVAAVGPAQAQTAAPKWGAHIDLEGRWGERRALGDIGLFAPLWQSPTSLFFADVRGKLDDHESAEGNFGLGLRRMLPNGWNLGGYGYFDYRRSTSGHYFTQATFGIEALSVDFDLRANAYVPFGERTKILGTTGGGGAFAELAGGTIQVVTPGTGQLLERALTGFDGEVGWRVPLFPQESLAQIRAYAGGYWFDGGGLLQDIYGPRGRLELSLDDMTGRWPGVRFTLGAEVQHDRLRGTQAFAMARLRIPLQVPDRAPARLTAQEMRMTERVVRDVDIVTGAGSGNAVPELREGAINEYNEQPVTDAVVVDAGAGADEAALQAALSGGVDGRVVILDGAINGHVGLPDNRTLIGGDAGLPVRGATTGTQMVFNAGLGSGSLSDAVGNSGNPDGVVVLGPGAVVGGLTIANTQLVGGGFSHGILMFIGTNATIVGNTISTIEDDSAAIKAAGSGIRIIGNTIATTGVGSDGIELGEAANTTIADNVFGPIGDDVILVDDTITSSSFVTASSTGNSVVGTVGGGRCNTANANPGANGTVAFTDGNNCSLP